MTISEAKELLTYDRWATDRILQACSNLSHDQLHDASQGAGTDIHGRLLHLLKTKHEWLLGMVDKDWTHMRVPSTASVSDLTAYHLAVEASVQDCMLNVDDSRLAEVYQHPMSYGDIVTHAVNHGTYHRGQIAAQLTAINAAFDDTDFFYWRLDCIGLPPPP